MQIPEETQLLIKEAHLTIAKEHIEACQQVLAQAAQAGYSPCPHEPNGDALAAWGLSIIANQHGAVLHELSLPANTTLPTFDTLLSLIAPCVTLDRPAYFNVVFQTLEGDREFFYHFERGTRITVIKEERITIYIPADLESMLVSGGDHLLLAHGMAKQDDSTGQSVCDCSRASNQRRMAVKREP